MAPLDRALNIPLRRRLAGRRMLGWLAFGAWLVGAAAACSGGADGECTEGELGCVDGIEYFKPCGERTLASTGDVLFYTNRTYDAAGNNIRGERDNSEDGSVEDVFDYAYNEAGALTLSKADLGPGTTVRETTVQYDDLGRHTDVAWMENFVGDERDLHSTFVHDGAVTTETRTRGETSHVEHRDYTYEGTRLDKLEVACDDDPTIVYETIYSYDSGGRIERAEERAEGELKKTTIYEYDGQQRLVRVELTTASGSSQWSAFEYDADGTLVVDEYGVDTLVGGNPYLQVTTTSYDPDRRPLDRTLIINNSLQDTTAFLYECPDYEDSPGRAVGKVNPVPSPPGGPRAPATRASIVEYRSGTVCP